MVNISVLGFRTKSNFASDNVYQLLAHMVVLKVSVSKD
jgi:hypothetical protein